MFTEFPNRGWTLTGLGNLIKNIDKIGSIDRKSGSGRPRSAQTNDNIEYVEEEILSTETNPGSHSTPAEISKRLDISESSVRKILKNDLKLNPFKQMKCQVLSPPNKLKRIVRARKLLKQVAFNKLNRTFFSDEKVFKKDLQNCRVHAPCDQKKGDISDSRLYCCRMGFPKSAMVTIGVSKLGKTSVIFIDEGAKINQEYYCSHCLASLIPGMDNLADNNFVFM